MTATSTNTVGTTNHSHAITTTTAGLKNTIVQTDSSGDITARYFRSTAGNSTTISGAMAYRISDSDNYIRFCSSTSAIKTWLGLNNVGNDDFKNYGLGISTGHPPKVENIDDITIPTGFYYILNPTGTLPQKPVAGATLLVEAYRLVSTPYVKQTLTYNEDRGGHCYYRTYHGSNQAWSEWRELWHSGNLNPVTINTAQDISGTKTFSTLRAKKVTLMHPSTTNAERGIFEYMNGTSG